MSNFASNPWSISHADIVLSVPTVLVLNADGTVSLTTAGAHGLVQDDSVTLIGNTPAAYNGFYHVISATATTAQLMPFNGIPAGTGAGAAFGNASKCLYRDWIRLEDISWQNVTAAGQSLDLRDRNGNILWQATAAGAGVQNRGKLFWVYGLTPILIDAGVVLLTIN